MYLPSYNTDYIDSADKLFGQVYQMFVELPHSRPDIYWSKWATDFSWVKGSDTYIYTKMQM